MFKRRPNANVKADDVIKKGDIVLVWYNTGNSYYMAVVMDIDEDEEMATVQGIRGIQEIQPIYCMAKATLNECVEELKSLYGFYS